MSKQKQKAIYIHKTCSELVVFVCRTGKSLNNFLSYCGLVEPRISTSNKDLPVKGPGIRNGLTVIVDTLQCGWLSSGVFDGIKVENK